MAHIVILGAGIGGLPMAFEMKENARDTDRVTVISNTPTFHFVPSNPWVAVDWRDRDEIELPIAPNLEKKGVDFIAVGAKRVHPERNVVELTDGREVPYDQRNPKYPNIFAVGVCVAIAPTEPTPVPTGVPKTGYMIESMVTATAHNVRAILDGQAPKEKATWNAVCLADFGDRGAAFVALPQIPSRNVNWFGEGYWVHLAKIAFEKYFIRKMKKGTSEPIYEKIVMQAMGIMKLKDK